MDKNNPQKQKSSLYLLKSKANMLRFICIKIRQYLEKQHFTKENKPLPCSKPGPPHLAFNPAQRAFLYSGTGITSSSVVYLEYIWMYCLFHNAAATESKDLEKIFVVLFAAKEDWIHSRWRWTNEQAGTFKPAGDQWRKCSSLVKSFITATTQSGLYNVDATRVFPCSSVSWIIECTVRHRPCLSGLHELDCFRIINNSNIVKLSKLVGLDLVLA